MNFVGTSKVLQEPQTLVGCCLADWAVLHHPRNTRPHNTHPHNSRNMDRSFLTNEAPWPFAALFGSIRWLPCHPGKHLPLEQAQRGGKRMPLKAVASS